MSITLLASACPAVQVNTVPYTRALGYSTSGGSAPSARSLLIPDMTAVQKWNENAVVMDDSFIHGGGSIRAVCWGLSFTVAGGNIAVAAGQARIDGLVELAVNVSGIGVSDGQKYLWLTQVAGSGAGTVVVRTNLTPPSAACVFLGSVLVSGGAGTADYSGVVRTTGGGYPFFETADTGTPSGTPPAGIMLTAETQAGTFLWNGMRSAGGRWIGPMGSVDGGSF